MGNNSSSENSSIINKSDGLIDGVPINSNEYTYISNVFDERYGEVKIMKHVQTNELIALSTRVLNSDSQLKRMIGLFSNAQKHQVDYIVKLIAFQQTKKEEFCGSFYKIQAVFEYLTNNIQKDITSRNKFPSNPYSYTLAELLHIAKNTLLALLDFKTNGYSHSDLRPSNMLIDPFGRVKLLDSSMLPGTVTGYANLLMGASDKCYLAPELLAKLRHRDQNPVHNPYKNEVFSLGMSLIEAANFSDISRCYEIGDFVVNEIEITKEINKTGLRYGSEFENLLRHMLVINEVKRFSIEEALQAIGVIERGGGKIADKLGDNYLENSGISHTQERVSVAVAPISKNESYQNQSLKPGAIQATQRIDEGRSTQKEEDFPYKDNFYYSLDDYHPPEGISKTSFFVDHNGSPLKMNQQNYHYDTPKDPGSNFNPVTMNSNSTLDRNPGPDVNLFAGGLSTHDGANFYENEKRFVTFQQEFDSDKGKTEDFTKFGNMEDRYEKLISSQKKIEAFNIIDERQYNFLESESGRRLQTSIPAAGAKELIKENSEDPTKFISQDRFEFVSNISHDSKGLDLSNQGQYPLNRFAGMNSYTQIHSLNSNPSQTLNPDYFTSEKYSRIIHGDATEDSTEFLFSRPVSLRPEQSSNNEGMKSSYTAPRENSYVRDDTFNGNQKSSRLIELNERSLTSGTPVNSINRKTEYPSYDDKQVDRVTSLLNEMKTSNFGNYDRNSGLGGGVAGNSVNVSNGPQENNRKSYSQRVEDLLKTVSAGNAGRNYEDIERNNFPKVSQLLESERFGHSSGFLKKSGYSELRSESAAADKDSSRRFDNSGRSASPYGRVFDDYRNPIEKQPFGIYAEKI